MKVKKILASVFASLFAVTTVATLTSCDEEEPAPTPDTGDTDGDSSNDSTGGNDNTGGNEALPTDAEIVQAALDALKVSSSATENFTLTTKGTGNVAISWASDNTAVISISEGTATVNRPSFTEADATVKLTATAVLNNATKTKEFTVTVAHLVDESKTVSEIKALNLGTEVIAKGVLTGFVYAAGTTDPEYACGYYVTDSTGTIYVYDPSGADDLAVGNELYLTGELSSKNSGIQISSVSEVQVITEEKTADWTTVVKDKTVKDIADAADKASTCGVVYELLVKFDKHSSYKTYYLQDVADNSKSILVFFSGSATNDKNDYKFDELIKDNIGKIARVRFVVNSLNSSNPPKPRGTVLEILPLTAEDQASLIDEAVKGAVELGSHITTAQEKALPTTIDGFDKCSIAWSLKDGSTGASITDNKLTITPTTTLQTFTLVATITVEGATDPIVVEYAESMVKTSFDPVSYQEYLAAADGDKLFIQGTIIAVGGYNSQYNNANVMLQDATTGGYYVFRFPCEEADIATGGKYALGTVVKVYGAKDIYNTAPQIKEPLANNIQVIQAAQALPTPTDISGFSAVADLSGYANTLVVIDQVLYTGSNFVTKDGILIDMYTDFYTPTLEAGKVYGFSGTLYNDKGTCKLTPTSSASFAEVTSGVFAEFVQLYLYGIFGQGKAFDVQTVVNVPAQLFGYNLTYAVTSATPTVTYENNKVTINPTVAETSTLTVTPENGTPFNISITTSLLATETTLTIADYATANSWVNSTQYLTVNVDSQTTATVAGGGNTGKYYTNGNNWRLYQGEEATVTITSTRTIASVCITYTVSSTGVLLNGTTQVESESVVTVNANTITFGVGNTGSATNGQVRISSIKVVYA